MSDMKPQTRIYYVPAPVFLSTLRDLTADARAHFTHPDSALIDVSPHESAGRPGYRIEITAMTPCSTPESR